MDMFYLGWFWGSKCNKNCQRFCLQTRFPTCHTLSVFQTVLCTGGSSSKYEHRHCCVTFEILGRLYGEKPIVSVTNENERISIKSSLPYIKCVKSLLCGPWASLLPFYGL